MGLYEQIIEVYPELENSDEFAWGSIRLQDDADGQGAYIREWNYSKPIPKGLKLGK